jgi:drug/metabolite transporter (DMT)-like permease
MTKSDPHIVRAHGGMLLRAIVIGVSFKLVGGIGEALPPVLLTAIRFAIAALTLLPSVWRSPAQLPGLRAIVLYSLLGLCQAAFFGAMFWAAHLISALSMAVLNVSVPFLAYCIGLLFGVEEASTGLVGILVLGASGALGLAWAERGSGFGGIQRGFHFGAADAVFFVGCLGLALYSVLSKWGLSRQLISQQAGIRTFWGLLIGAFLAATLGSVVEAPRALMRLTSSDWLLLGFLGVVSTGATFWLMQRATAVLSPATVTAYSYAPPFVAMLLLFINEPGSISWRWLPGASLVLVAIALLLRRDAERALSRDASVRSSMICEF